jgi:hypothetical protein
MNDFDLDSKLKSVPLPERPEDYWESFPAKVRLNMRRARTESARRNLWLPRAAWADGFALAVVLLFFCVQFQPLKTTSVVIQKQENHLRMQFAQFQTKLRVFMQDEHGMHYLIAEKE